MVFDVAWAWFGRALKAAVIWGALAAHSQVLVTTNATWAFRKGLAEPSAPPAAWRDERFDIQSWSSGRAPFYYDTEAVYGGATELADMRNRYTTLYLRREFEVGSAADVASLTLRFYCDDGFALWINGQWVTNYNHAGVDYGFSAVASANASEPIVWLGVTIPGPFPYLHTGTNTLAVQAFNVSRTSSDFIFDLELKATLSDRQSPTVVAVDPPPGDVSSLRTVTVTFSEPVAGIGFSDLLINQRPASAMAGVGAVYTFTFDPVAEGVADITWDAGAGIHDFANPPNRFDGSVSRWAYTVVDRMPPEVIEVNPPPSVIVRGLDQIEVRFNEPVAGVEAGDLALNGAEALSVTGTGAGPYLFRFSSPSAGTARLSWRDNHGIRDHASTPNAFVGGSWVVTVDPDAVLPSVRISEWLAGYSGEAGLHDEDDELQDWIELENLTDTPVNLKGWSLTDDAQDPGLWVLPDTVLAPRGFVVVFASGKDRRGDDTRGRRHTNFKLGLEGEYLGLYNAESPRRVVSEVAPVFPALRPDVSGGLDDQGQLRIFAVPTPGAANLGDSLDGVVPPVDFSATRGVFDAPFELTLSCARKGAEIRYTTDGSEPGIATGIRYTAPLQVGNTLTLRAAAFQQGALASPSVTHSYLFPAHAVHQTDTPTGLPAQWLDTQGRAWTADYGMDPEVVDALAYKDRMVEALKSLPIVSLVAKPADLFDNTTGIYPKSQARGPSWERPASVEFISSGNEESFQANCGIQMQGNSVRDPVKTAKHSFRLVFKGDYGPPKLHFRIFPDSPIDEFDTLILRADFNNSWMHWNGAQRPRGQRIRDAWMKDSQRAMGGLASHSRFFHLYLNGLYWGVYDATERPDAAFAASYLGGSKADFDVMNEGQVVDGTAAAYNAMRAIDNLASDEQYAKIKEYLDVPGYIDYVLLHFYVGHEDWFTDKNWYAIRRRAPGQGYRYLSWDGEMILSGADLNIVTRTDQPSNLHPKLRENAQYRLDFADRVQRHFFQGGALTPETAAARYDRWASRVSLAMIAESARWGDYRRDVHPYSSGPYVLYTVDEHFAKERNRLLTQYFPARTRTVLTQLRAAGLYPATAVAPEFNATGGTVVPGFRLTMSVPTGTVFFTTNGQDPRLPFEGTVAASAQAYQSAVVLDQSMVVKARARVGSEWSALSEAIFEVGELGPSIAITEIHYRPSGGSPYEFLELANFGRTPLDVGGFSLEGVRYVFPPGTILQPNTVVLLASAASPTAFAGRYPGVPVFGWFEGELANGGERIAVLDRDGRSVTSLKYRIDEGWPDLQRHAGSSIELVDPVEDPGAAASWQSSKAAVGTPGIVARRSSLPEVRINEVSTTGDVLGSDWVELVHRGMEPVDMSGWILTDHGNASAFVFPVGTLLAPGSFLLIRCDGGPAVDGEWHASFSLDAEGETLSLLNASQERVDAVSFGPQAAGFTLARLGGDGGWRVAKPTPGAENLEQEIGSWLSIRINEWLANAPPDADDWIELYNADASVPVDLRSGWLTMDSDAFRIRSPTVLGPLSFLVLAADGRTDPGHLDFRLPALGGAIGLHDAQAVRVDRVAYAHHDEGVSEGRMPDGGDAFQLFRRPTPGTGNSTVILRPPRMEIVAVDRVQWTLRIQGAAGYPHRMEASVDLKSWQLLGTTVPAASPFTWTLPITGAEATRFLRVSVFHNGNSP
ncbi:MAG: lamin tail domain-containing protein [Verrucomicrobiales bacterium]|nr:lamin tail domain-containing protein [Verrucomicrobiales bacterium]